VTDTVTETDRGVRALWLSALVVFSVFVTPVALSGVGVAANDAGNAAVSIESPTDRTVVQSDDTLTVQYTDTGATPADLTVTLDADDGEYTQTYTIDDSQFVNDGELVSVNVDLNGPVDSLADDQYSLTVTATDGDGDDRTATTDEIVVVDDDAPGVSLDGVNQTDDIAPGEAVDVTFTLSEASNVSSSAVAFRQDGSTRASVPLGSFDTSEDGTTFTETVTVPEDLADNEDYRLAVTATDESGQTGTALTEPTAFDVNAERPTVSNVDADVNNDTLVVNFSEPVSAADGTFDTTEFSYVDNDGQNADAITGVTQTTPSEVSLTLNETVDAAELGTDAVDITEFAVVDSDAGSGDDNGRYVPSGATTLTDQTTPAVGVSPSAIDIANADSYPVTVETTTEPTNVSVEVIGLNGTTVSNATSERVTGATTLTVDTSGFDDGSTTVFVNATDASDNEQVVERVVTRDTARPTVTAAEATVGVQQIELRFSEPVTVGADAVSVDVDGVSVERVDSSTSTTATVVLDGSVPESALDDTPATVTVTAPGADTVGNTFAADGSTQSLTNADLVELRTSADGDTVTITVATDQEIDAVVDGISVVEQNRELAAADSFALEPRFETTVAAEAFREVSTGVYEATVDVGDDDVYQIEGVGRSDTVVVDTSGPTVVDAAVVGVSSDAQLDDSRNTTRLRVLFDEPVQAGLISPSDLSIEGFSGDVVAVQPAGAFGAVEVVVEGDVQTAGGPVVELTGGTYADEAGRIGSSVSTTLHTDVLELSAGTNFVSVPAASGGLSVEALPTAQIDAIFAYNATTESFESYDPDAPENDFTTLEGGKGYIVEMDASATVAINVPSVPTGQAPPNAQQLSEGYNLIGHYQEDEQTVPVALSSLFAGESGNFSDTVFRLLGQADGAAGYEYESYRAGEFVVMERGEAYWVFVTDDQVYTETPFGSDGPQIVHVGE
jgi:hypothetical protein